jgi:hypothetical protein
MESPLGEIEKNGGVAVYRDPGEEDVDREQQCPEHAPPHRESPGDVRWVEEVAGSVGIDGSEGVEVGLFDGGHGWCPSMETASCG